MALNEGPGGPNLRTPLIFLDSEKGFRFLALFLGMVYRTDLGMKRRFLLGMTSRVPRFLCMLFTCIFMI